MDVETRWFATVTRLRTQEPVVEFPRRCFQAVLWGRTGLLQPDEANEAAPPADATAATHGQREARRRCSARTRVDARAADPVAMPVSPKLSMGNGESGCDVERPRSAASEPPLTRRGCQVGQSQNFRTTGTRP